MAIITQEEALERADQIRDEEDNKENTAERVGQLLHDAFQTLFGLGGGGSAAVQVVDGADLNGYDTLQEAITDNLGEGDSAFIKILASPGTYAGFTLTKVQQAYVSIACKVPAIFKAGLTEAPRVVIDGDIELTGSEGGSWLTFQDVEVSEGSTIAAQYLGLIRSRVLATEAPSIAAATFHDSECSLTNPASATDVYVTDIKGTVSGLADAAADQNAFPANYRFTGDFIATIYVRVTTPATTGTLDLEVDWNDIDAARTQSLINDLDITSGGPGYYAISFPVQLNSSPLTFTTTTAGGFTAGPLAYSVTVSLHRMSAQPY